MSKQAPAARASRRGTSKSRAVAGAADIRGAGTVPAGLSGTLPSREGERHWGHARRAGQQRRRRAADSEWVFQLELPDPMPVLPAELAALEAHLGAIIDAILAGEV
jgi:hypothetical protein